MSYPNRYACQVMDEMRACFKTLNFSPIPGMIEELQSMFNKMESSIEDKSDIKDLVEERSELQKEVNKLRKTKRNLTAQGQ